MGMEAEEDRMKFDTNFRALIFANDPARYYEMFEKEDEQKREAIEQGIEWLEPDNIEEINEILEDLKRREQ